MNTNAANPATPRGEQMLAAIARQVLGLETLETRNAGHLDFHELAVWQLRQALRLAYSAGYEDAISDAGEDEELVDADEACPNCGKRDRDGLIWQDDDTILCTNCGTRYDLDHRQDVAPSEPQ